jgi:hypothetical protein
MSSPLVPALANGALNGIHKAYNQMFWNYHELQVENAKWSASQGGPLPDLLLYIAPTFLLMTKYQLYRLSPVINVMTIYAQHLYLRDVTITHNWELGAQALGFTITVR